MPRALCELSHLNLVVIHVLSVAITDLSQFSPVRKMRIEKVSQVQVQSIIGS